MAYTVVPTAITGDLWTAANHNTYIKDNFAAGVPDIFTAAGDIAYATGDNAATVLPIGTFGQYLRVNEAGNAPEWGNTFIGCAVSRDAELNCTDTDTTVIFDTEIFDTHNMWESSSPTLVTVPYTGYYEISGFVNFSSSDSSTGTEVILEIETTSKLSVQRAVLEEPPRTTVLPFFEARKLSAGGNVDLGVLYTGNQDWQITAHMAVIWIGST